MITDKKNVAIIGRGNVGTHLSRSLSSKVYVTVVNPHTLAELTGTEDIILISVSDAALPEVAGNLASHIHAKCNPIVAHTSGTTPMDVLSGLDVPYGVFYPMQTFSKDVDLNYADIPMFIEGSDAEVSDVLMDLAGLFSDHVHYADSEKRRKLHIGSVFACNFANHLWTLSEKWLKENGLDFSMMHALIRETTRKALSNSPASVQTGPARRHDAPTIKSHLKMLEGNPQLHDIYIMLTDSIENSYHE